MGKEKMDASKEIEEIGKILNFVLEDPDYNTLLTEIVWSALNFAIQVPNATVVEAMEFGYGEWTK